MANRTNSQFREDEIVIMTHWDKKEEAWVKTVYPKVGGRLRLAHEDNQQLSISTEIIRYDENVAVIAAVMTTNKGSFKGFGMASVDRDKTIAPAILELAETRAIARSLRFAGFGVEYCSAEEISHLENSSGKGSRPNDSVPSQQHARKEAVGGKGGNGERPHEKNNQTIPSQHESKGGNGGKPVNGGNGDNAPTDEGNGRLSAKQHSYILDLIRQKGITRSELNKECVTAYGVVPDYLTRADASSLIDQLLNQ